MSLSLKSVFLFTKPLDRRLSEFRAVLCLGQPPISANEVADEWSYFAELVVEPTGWQAVWKVCRHTCNEFNLKFPSYIIVYVESVDYKELAAVASILKVQEDISLPQRLEVPLKHLYPLKDQENSALNVEKTADYIDQLRFFYSNIWQPWDLDDEDGDWAGKYLEPRLTLYYEMRNEKKFPQKLADRIYNKIQKAQQLYDRKKELEEILSDREMSGKDFDHDILTPGINNNGCELLKIHLELNPLIKEIQLLENPTMRTLSISQFLIEEEENSKSFQFIFVWNRGSLDMLKTCIENTESFIQPTAIVRSTSSLELAMEMATSGHTILLHPGLHMFSGRIEASVTIKGIGENVHIKRDESCSHLLNVHGNRVILENITLDAQNVEGGIIVPRNTELQLSKCSILGQSLRATTGIIVLTGGTVVLENCNFNDLHTAIQCYAEAKVIISESSIQKCQDGLVVHEQTHLTIENSSIMMCANAGIVCHCKTENDEVGSTSLLKKVKDVSIRNVVLKNNCYDVQLLNSEKSNLIL